MKPRPSSRCDRDARVAVRPVGMMKPAQLVDHRIDLDGIDVAGPLCQRGRDVVARAGADDQHVVKRFSARVAIEQMGQEISRPRADRPAASPGARGCSPG